MRMTRLGNGWKMAGLNASLRNRFWSERDGRASEADRGEKDIWQRCGRMCECAVKRWSPATDVGAAPLLIKPSSMYADSSCWASMTPSKGSRGSDPWPVE